MQNSYTTLLSTHCPGRAVCRDEGLGDGIREICAGLCCHQELTLLRNLGAPVWIGHAFQKNFREVNFLSSLVCYLHLKPLKKYLPRTLPGELHRRSRCLRSQATHPGHLSDQGGLHKDVPTQFSGMSQLFFFFLVTIDHKKLTTQFVFKHSQVLRDRL